MDEHCEIAIIDIGSNTVRYMGKYGAKRVIATRLGFGLDRTRRLDTLSMGHTLEALVLYYEQAKEEGSRLFAYATSAVRDAENGQDFVSLASKIIDAPIDVLSPDREAEYAILGARAEALIDIGGGSFQIATREERVSFPIGCVRAKDLVTGMTVPADMERAVKERVAFLIGKTALPKAERYTGVGGTVTTLAALWACLDAYDGEVASRVTLTSKKIDVLIERLFDYGEHRQSIPLLETRHDVIIPGAYVLKAIMERLGVDSLLVSDRDGMEGYRDYILSRETI